MNITVKTHSNVYDEHTKSIQITLCKEGLLTINDVTGYYDIKTERAYKKYQKKNGKAATGVFNTEVLNINNERELAIRDTNGLYAKNMARYNDIDVPGGNSSTNSGSGIELSSKTYDVSTKDREPFFNDKKSPIFRKGNLDIVINYSNSQKQKRVIEGVKIRSVSQLISSDGEVIADVYNFVARDLIENN